MEELISPVPAPTEPARPTDLGSIAAICRELEMLHTGTLAALLTLGEKEATEVIRSCIDTLSADEAPANWAACVAESIRSRLGESIENVHDITSMTGEEDAKWAGVCRALLD